MSTMGEEKQVVKVIDGKKYLMFRGIDFELEVEESAYEAHKERADRLFKKAGIQKELKEE
jgi:hypothetical protein